MAGRGRSEGVLAAAAISAPVMVMAAAAIRANGVTAAPAAIIAAIGFVIVGVVTVTPAIAISRTIADSAAGDGAAGRCEGE
jgi:hypothetical protein